jgi:hypothetical protein
MPSTMYLILSSPKAKPRRVSKDTCCRCNHRRAGERSVTAAVGSEWG